MESLTQGIRHALYDPALAPIWFRQLSHNNVFTGKPFHVTLHRVQRYPDGNTVYLETEAHAMSKLEATIRAPCPDAAGHEPVASLQLLKLRSVTPDQFLALLAEYQISDATLLAMNSGTFHFQVFKEHGVNGRDPTGICLGLAYNVATIMWRYDSVTRATRAIAIGDDDRPLLRKHFERFKSDLTHPLAFAAIALQVQLEKFHKFQRDCVRKLADLEQDTGFRSEAQVARKMNFARLQQIDLNWMAQTISNIHYEAFSLERTFGAVKAIIVDLMALAKKPIFADTHLTGTALCPDRKTLKISLRWCVKSIEAHEEQIRYLTNRVRVQNTIIFNFSAQKDAQVQIGLAESSKQLTEAAKRDSSSMQTVAVLTMVVLPATFFAALFAMPLLKWDQTPVIQARFWIYLAFTIPSTAIIFVVWIVLTKLWLVKKYIRRFRKWHAH